MADRTGEQFGNYRLLRLIGRGGFADVYLGEHIYLHTQAALKILQVRLTDDALETFLSEARTIVQLEHPHIVRVLECSVEKDVPFLAMNYAPGGSLRQRHPPGTRLPVEQVSLYITQIASALQYAHERKFIHRDVKPENMLLGQNDQLLLSDFGLVLLAQSTGSQTTKEMAGTVPYMAPEQLQGRPRPASDQYALGIVAYEWLSGERPFRGSFVEIASQHILSAPPPLVGRIPGISPEVEHIMLTALAKNPEERFASVQDFANALGQTIEPTLAAGQISTLPTAAPSATLDLEATSRSAPRRQTAPGRPFIQPDPLSTAALSESSQPIYVIDPQAHATPVPSESSQPTYVIGMQAYTTPDETPIHKSTASQNTPVVLPPVNPPGSQADTDGIHALNAQREHKRRSARTLVVLFSIILLLLLIGTPFLLTRGFFQSPGTQSPGTGTGRTSSPTPPTSTAGLASSTATRRPTTTSMQPASAQPTPTPTSSTSSNQPMPFSVSGVDASVSPSNFHGVCTDPMTFTFMGTIRVPAGTSGGTVSYTWLRSDGATGPIETVSFNPGATTLTVTTTWQLGSVWGNGTTFWEALQVTSPNSLTSAHANFSFVCQSPAPTVTSISASVSPGSYDCSKSQVTFNFSATIYLGANPSGVDIIYVWQRSDGATMSPITISVPAGQTTAPVTDTWTLGVGAPTGSYWEQVAVSAPNNISSNQATFTKSC